MFFAAIGGIFASTVFMEAQYPTYRDGVWCTVGTQFFLIVLVALMTLYFKNQNGKADRGEKVIQEDPTFRYTF
jgi:hypothetical protein